MSLSISRLLNLSKREDQYEKLLGNNPDIPNRYNVVKNAKGFKMPDGKNHYYDPYEFDQFNEIMKQDSNMNYNVTNAYLYIRSKKGTDLPNYDLEGSIDPAVKRRMIDPMTAPPPDFAYGTERQKFGISDEEIKSYDNVSLIKLAHNNYNKWINRYNIPSIPVTIQRP